ncbi:PAS domain-containing protein [Steroidobacter sp. S1-65]|uniref:PAS domain-containing protein n=1 Tax=Steroidobacter gossypii TaxID=2805490 RepID=A0ABS1WQD1_9GAMM|nr:chemotaxis protein CheB [Steroidobacter gossypii]MBM0103188.1 PAS domain-containing protein [Steroidobacter gossypii]
MTEKVEEIANSPGLLSPDRPNLGAHPAPCPVVGLGASAGGLEAFQIFLSGAPADAGLAYVLVQHLDPNHESMLAELLARRTSMTVRQISDNMAIEPNCVYLIPPNAQLTIEKARLRLSGFSEPRGFRRPIDVFFRSLAVDQGSNAACVVLSGTGADGSEGLRAIKEAGGLTVVQEPDTAKYDGMPKSAVATGLVDQILPVGDMPAAIRDYFERAQASVVSLPDVTDFLLGVCELLRHRLGHDFSQYKRSTMLRRVQRRMQVVGASTGEEYLDRLQTKPDEARLLFRDLLINVTCFFRDAEAFDFLRREVIPELLRDKGASDTVRIWTPGCSSGEEAYSIAILLAEAMSRMAARPTVQIFATDIDEAMLHKARLASYPQSAVKDVPLELLDRYFYAQDDDFVLTQSVRDMVRVSNHNLIKDPPFSRVDMIVCRNLLIYLNTSLQQRLIPVFHYALKPDGWLFLGSAENIAARNDIFDTVEASAKVYRRRGVHRQSVAMPLFVQPLAMAAADAAADRHRIQSERPDSASRRILERYAPPHVVVNGDNDIVRASSRTGKYLELAEGTPSTRVTDLAKRGLRSAVRAVLEGARTTRKRTVKRDVTIEVDEDNATLVDVIADPLNDDEVLLVFQDAGATPEAALDGDVQAEGYSQEDRIKQLEDELDETRSRLRTTVEELETSNEELKSSNEEMMSMNEELQSANEELATVNEELKNKVDQLARANSDLQNFIESTQVPTIFLDRKMRIRSFTPATRALFRFQEQDRGRPLSDVVSRADHRELEALGAKVLETDEPIERELLIDGGKECYVLRVLPYQDLNAANDGVIMVFADVTKVRQAQADLARNEDLARQRSQEIETLYKTAPIGMATVDRSMRFLRVNQRFADVAGHEMEALIGRTLQDMIPALATRMTTPIKEVFDQAKETVNIDATVRMSDEAMRDFLIDFYPYEEDGRTTAVGVVLTDVTEVRRLEKELRRLMDELQHRVKNTLATVASIVNQTVSSKTDRGDLVQTLKRRIGALAATHTLLTLRDWRDASLRDILQAELTPYEQHDRIKLEGPDVRLPPKHALSLTMTLHELTTNAAKYGALAREGGRLAVTWTVNVDAQGKALTLHWIESGVAGISPADVKQGFGTRLIKSAVVHDLQGACDYRLADGGLNCTLSMRF